MEKSKQNADLFSTWRIHFQYMESQATTIRDENVSRKRKRDEIQEPEVPVEKKEESNETSEIFEGPEWPFRAGDHIKIKRELGSCTYWHHGIYIGDGKVVHFGGGSGYRELLDAAIQEAPMSDFYGNSKILEIVKYTEEEAKFSGDQVVERAKSMTRKNDPYHLIHNNCEHFATWCITGEKRSKQMDSFMTGGDLIQGAKRRLLNFFGL